MSSSPTMMIPQMIVRSKQGVELFHVSSSSTNRGDCSAEKSSSASVSLVKDEFCPFHSLSADGRCLLLVRPSVGLLKVDLGLLAKKEDSPNDDINLTLKNNEAWEQSLQTSFVEITDSSKLALAYFSPLGKFIVTWERPVKGTNGGPPPNNLKLWRSSDGSFCGGWFVKTQPRKLKDDCSFGPYSALQFVHDEAFFGHLVSNEVQFYDTQGLLEPSNDDGTNKLKIRFKVRCAGIGSFSLADSSDSTSKANGYLMTSFVPEIKGRPVKITLHKLELTTEGGKETVISSKSFYQTESVTVKWSPKGDSALVQTHTTVDTSGQSYYGSSTLHLIQSNSSNTLQITLPSSKSSSSTIKDNNPVVHDVAWCPNPSSPPRFIVISGSMPALATLHNGVTGDAVFALGEAHRNLVSWSPHGRFFCLAGFGNLAGGMDFWDKNKLKPMPRFDPISGQELSDTIRAHCPVHCGWSPDSRVFFVSTTSPRMNVDNGIRLYKYNGYGPYLNVPWNDADYQPNKLVAVDFVPAPNQRYPDRPQSPPPSLADKNSVHKATLIKDVHTATAPAPAAVGRYVPPSARNRAGVGNGTAGASLAERMRREREDGLTGPRQIRNTGKNVIPGLTSSSSTPDPNAKSKSAQRRERQKLARQRVNAAKQEQQEEEEARAVVEKDDDNAATPVVVQDPQKRAKKIKKTLKQIEELKRKDEGQLNEDQRKKITTEQALRDELNALAL